MTVRIPTEMTAATLAEILTQYGDMKVVLGLVDGEDYASMFASNIRPEVTGIGGSNYLALVGYLDESFKEANKTEDTL
jgi:hypothetical protein